MSDILFKAILKNYEDRFEVIKLLMIKFGLIVAIVDDMIVSDVDNIHYLVPALLPEKKNEAFVSIDCFYMYFSTSKETINGVQILSRADLLKYGFLPKGLFSRLLAKIVLLSRLTTKSKYFAYNYYKIALILMKLITIIMIIVVEEVAVVAVIIIVVVAIVAVVVVVE